MHAPENKLLILFDGECHLCNASVQFVLRRDPGKRFRFAPLQSAIGRKVQSRFPATSAALNSILLVEGNHVYSQSTAALRIARRLNKLWPLAYVFILIPRPMRDWIYRIIANNRYRWFGKRTTCWLPTDEFKERFLSDEPT